MGDHVVGRPALRPVFYHRAQSLCLCADKGTVEAGIGQCGRADLIKRAQRTTSEDAQKYRATDELKFLHAYLKGLLNEWEGDLAARSEEVASTAAGRLDAKL